MSGQRCWAYGPQGRCELEGGHDEPHEIVTRWNDEETITFDGRSAVVDVPIYQQTLIDSAFPVQDPNSVMLLTRSDKCFTCGCLAEAHLEESDDGETMCRKHQCRTFVPDF